MGRLIVGIGASRLTDLEPNRVESYLQSLSTGGRIKKGDPSTDKELSAGSVNQHRATAVAFVAWCVQNQRAPDNPLKMVTKLDERRDRRRVRRAFTAEEAAVLFAAGGTRRSVYVIAAYARLRRGELSKITWPDVDLMERTLTIRVGVGKAAHQDCITLHPYSASELVRVSPEFCASRDRVFPKMPRDRTFRADLERAKVAPADKAGRVVDFHALRATFGTNLARAGVMPRVAMRLMRHADVKITMKHYTDLRLHDEAKAVALLPRITESNTPICQKQQATGTHGASIPASTEGKLVVAPAVAHGALEGAPPFGVVQNHGREGVSFKLTGVTGDSPQTRYTSALSTPVHQGAKGKGRTERKPLPESLLRAISAVG